MCQSRKGIKAKPPIPACILTSYPVPTRVRLIYILQESFHITSNKLIVVNGFLFVSDLISMLDAIQKTHLRLCACLGKRLKTMTATRAFRHNPVVSRLPLVGHENVGHLVPFTKNLKVGVLSETDRDDLLYSFPVLDPARKEVPTPLWLIRGQPSLQVRTMDHLGDRHADDEDPPECPLVE